MARCPLCALALNTLPQAATNTKAEAAHPPLALPCGACTLHPPPLQQCVAALDYAYPWDKLIHRFKFHGEVAWARLFARTMAQAPGAAACLAQADWCLPIPLSLPRLGERGYNQSWELVKALTRGNAHQAQSDWLLKLADTPVQHQLDRAERLHNLQNAFATAAHALPQLANSSVLLVDDIMTTGATLHAAALALRRAGVAKVSALVLARTPAPGF